MKIVGDRALQDTLSKISSKAPEATSIALNSLAFEVRSQVQNKLPQWVDMTRPFLKNSVIYEKATASQPFAAVGFHKRADFVTLLEDGGTRLPKGRALAIPVDVKTNQKGGISSGNRPSAILQKKGVFSGVINGLAGIWQSSKRIKERLLYVFKPKATYDAGKYLHFRTTAKQVIAAQYENKFKSAITKILVK